MSVEGLSDVDGRWLIDEDSEASRLVFSMPGLPAEERVEGLRRLQEAAAVGGPRDIHLYALALCLIGLFEPGIELLEALVREGQGQPEFRLNLALAYLHVDLPDLAFDHLVLAADESAGTSAAGIASDRLAAATVRRANLEKEMRFLELRAAMLEEDADQTTPSATTLRELGLTLVDLTRQRGGDARVADAIAVLERARELAPDDAEILENLQLLYLAAGRTADRQRTLRALATVAPVSPSLASSREGAAGQVSDEAILRRKLLLVERIASPGGPSPGVISELRQLAKLLPMNPDYRTLLMQALSTRGEQEEALRIAEDLERDWPDSHNVHFNIAQIFWHSGQRERAERHLEAATRTAEDDQDRADVENLRAILDSGKDG